MFRKLCPIFVAALVLGAAALPASAQHRGRFGHRGGFGVGVHVGFGHRAPVPVVHAPRGHWEVVERRVWREGYYRDVHYAAEYATRYDHCGRPIRVCVRPARCEKVWVPGCWETVTERVWVEAYTTYGCGY